MQRRKLQLLPTPGGAGGFGINMSGAQAAAATQVEDDGTIVVDVGGEIIATGGKALERNVVVKFAILNRDGEVVGMGEEYVDRDGFAHYDAVSTTGRCQREPASFRVVVRPN